MDLDVGGVDCGDSVVRSPMRKCQRCEGSPRGDAVWGAVPDLPVWAVPAKGLNGERGSCSVAEAGAQRLRSVEGESALGWREFTPKEVDGKKCMARTWFGGQGGQCRSGPAGSGRYCKAHGAKAGTDAWLGAVDWPIPERKLGEFMKARKKREGEKTESKNGALQRLRRAGFSSAAEEGVGEPAVMEGGGGRVNVEEGSAKEGVAENEASRGAAAALAAGAAEQGRIVQAERGVGDREKMALMQQRSEARARSSGAEARK